MSTTKTPSLPRLYAQLAHSAARTGRDQQLELRGGARLCVRVVDSVTTLSIARKGKPVGDVELQTFRLACEIPPEAVRWPEAGQHQRADADGVAYHQVVFRWRTVEEPSV